jgi:aspartyl aminopeptidase
MMKPDHSAALDLADFIAAAPTPFHAAAQAEQRLTAAGFTQAPDAGTSDADATDLRRDGAREYLVRDGAVLAWSVPAGVAPDAPVRIVAAHTDSPVLKVKPRPDTGRAGWRQVGVEVYGGPLWNSWLDRDLSVAGRLVLGDGSTVLFDVGRPLLRVPQPAPHLDRGVNERGLKLDPQQHLAPVWGIGDVREGDMVEFLAAEVGVAAGDVAAHDLVLHDVTPPAQLGRDGELLAAPRLDNLSSTHGGLAGFLAAVDAGAAMAGGGKAGAEGPGADDGAVLVYAAFDHEEVGSESVTGAAGPLLDFVLRRAWPAYRRPLPAGSPAVTSSFCLSADAAHAAHPNYLEFHDPAHLLVPGGGPALKRNASQRYPTDAVGEAAWRRACEQADVPSQVFVGRNNLACGSTIGPSIASRTGIRTLDIGIPVLSMHSARELCGTADPGYLAAACAAFLAPRR